MGLSSSRWARCSRRAEEASGEQRGDLGNCPRQERGGRSWQKLLLRTAGMGWSLAAEPPRLWGEPLDVQRVTFFGEGVVWSFFWVLLVLGGFLNIITPSLGFFQKYNLEKKWSWRGGEGPFGSQPAADSCPAEAGLKHRSCSLPSSAGFGALRPPVPARPDLAC